MNRKKQLTPFGLTVRKRLLEIGMTQVELADQVGTTKGYLNKILNGSRSGEKYINKIVIVLGISPEELDRTA